MVAARHRWVLRSVESPSPALLAAGETAGLGRAAIAVLAGRGISTEIELGAYLSDPLAGLHDPRLLPDADALRARVAAARTAGRPVVVFGDFDADGLTGLAILTLALRRLGLEVIPYVPSRLDEGHGLSVAAVEAAERAGAALIVTVDTGSSSVDEVALARRRGIDVAITDHHRVPPDPPEAIALVNPHRRDAGYPDRRLSGAGVAFKVAQLLLADEPGGPEAALALADLATIGTVSDIAPIVGENRAIARLGLAVLRAGPRPGLAALVARAGIDPAGVDLEDVAFRIAPRLNAAGRVGSASTAAALLLASEIGEAASQAERLEADNATRRELTRQTLAEVREAVEPGRPAIVHGPWAVGVLGLVAGRLADETGQPAVVGADLGPVVRASCRSGPGVDLAAVLEACGDLLIRHGGHAGAAGLEVASTDWDALRDRLTELLVIPTGPDPRSTLLVDLSLPARAIDYHLVHDLGRLEPFGPGNPDPLVVISGLTVARVRAAEGGHTQLVLRRQPDVLDGIAFGRDDLPGALVVGEAVDVVARLMSRTFGGFESLQLEVRDVATAGVVAGASPTTAEAATTSAAVAGAR